MVMIWPSVISCAMPRPATIRISVAMMGCMPTLATSSAVPQAAHQRDAPAPPGSPAGIGKRLTLPPSTEPPIIQAASAAAMATTAPTEMSMPRVAITSVMPSDTSTSGAARLRMSIRLP